MFPRLRLSLVMFDELTFDLSIQCATNTSNALTSLACSATSLATSCSLSWSMIFYLIPGYRLAKTPGRYIPPSYTNTPQVVFVDTTDKLNTTLITELQAIIGTLLYYARAVDPTLLTIANELAYCISKPSQLNASLKPQTESSVTAALVTLAGITRYYVIPV